MEWVLLLGLGLIGIGIFSWIRGQQPTSPLLEEHSLQQLYAALDTVFQRQPDENPAYTHTSRGILLSYLYQHEMHTLDESTSPIHLHNFSLTIPKDQSDVLVWNHQTQTKIAHFILNTLKQNSVHAVMSSRHGILMINLLYTNEEQHMDLIRTEFPTIEDCSVLLKNNCAFDIQSVPEEMEQLIEQSEQTLAEGNQATPASPNAELA